MAQLPLQFQKVQVQELSTDFKHATTVEVVQVRRQLAHWEQSLRELDVESAGLHVLNRCAHKKLVRWHQRKRHQLQCWKIRPNSETVCSMHSATISMLLTYYQTL
jgi:hypothetical protein